MPCKFVVNGNIWTLVYVPPDDHNLMRSNGTYALGVTELFSHTVYINNRLRGDLLNKVICHEMCHVYMFENKVFVDLETEELIADFIATFGIDILASVNKITHKCI